MKKHIKYQLPAQPIHVVSEPEVLYITKPKLNEYKIGSFSNLNKILPLSQIEWADILHISDRTLQRYIKENKPFEGLYAEHLYQLESMANTALSVFGNPEKIKAWLIEPKQILGKTLDFSALRSFWGVRLLSNELGRMVHGVYI